MNFIQSLVQITKNVLKIGAQTVPVIVSAYDPPLGALIGTIVQSVMTVEAKGAASTDAKREAALSIVQAAMPAIEQIFTANLKAIQNPDLFALGVGKLQDGLVDIFNSTGQNTKPATAAAA